MSKHYVHSNGGRTCSSAVSFDYSDGKIINVKFQGGCTGNTQGVAALAEGMTPEEIVKRLKGIKCHGDNSCPNELAMAVEEMLASE